MTKTNARHDPALILPLSPDASAPEGEGVDQKCKTTVQENPAKNPNWRCGAPGGNRNAAKPVQPLSTLKRKIRDLRRRAKAAMALVPK